MASTSEDGKIEYDNIVQDGKGELKIVPCPRKKKEQGRANEDKQTKKKNEEELESLPDEAIKAMHVFASKTGLSGRGGAHYCLLLMTASKTFTVDMWTTGVRVCLYNSTDGEKIMKKDTRRQCDGHTYMKVPLAAPLTVFTAMGDIFSMPNCYSGLLNNCRVIPKFFCAKYAGVLLRPEWKSSGVTFALDTDQELRALSANRSPLQAFCEYLKSKNKMTLEGLWHAFYYMMHRELPRPSWGLAIVSNLCSLFSGSAGSLGCNSPPSKVPCSSRLT